MARTRERNGNGNGRRLITQQSVNGAIKAICDIMRRSNCAGALQYVPELTWILFLRILDERETREAEEAAAVAAEFRPCWRRPTAGRIGRCRQERRGRIEAKGREVGEAVAALRALSSRRLQNPRSDDRV